MQNNFKTVFIETRIGEPITALHQWNEKLAFGSMSGYYGVYNYKTNKL